MLTTRTIGGLLFSALLAGCDSDESVQFRADGTGSDTGHPCEGDGDGDIDTDPAPKVCGTTDGTFHYLDFDGTCDAGMIRFCYVGEYMAAASLVVCCDQLGLECNQQAANCQPELWHVCDTPF